MNPRTRAANSEGSAGPAAARRYDELGPHRLGHRAGRRPHAGTANDAKSWRLLNSLIERGTAEPALTR